MNAETLDVFEKVCDHNWITGSTKSMKFLLEYERDANPDIPKLALLAAVRYGNFVMLQLVLEGTSPFKEEVLVEAFRILKLQIDAEQARYGTKRRFSEMLTMKSFLEAKLPKDLDV